MFLIPVLGYCLLRENKHVCPKDAALQWQGCVCIGYDLSLLTLPS